MALNCFTRIDNVDFMCVLIFLLCFNYSPSVSNNGFLFQTALKLNNPRQTTTDKPSNKLTK
ncbi:MAG: hypothetical protein IKH45_05470 [Neisseriaceae bacterium]|nr:hypothetical protein [Neisseriaceae bacterium]